MRKICFNELYRLNDAVLTGYKEMTRRIANISLRHSNEYPEELTDEQKQTIIEKLSPYKVGEIVAIAQRYSDVEREYLDHKIDYPFSNFPHGEAPIESAGWKNKMFVKPDVMPHQIKITDIRLERLQNITKEDCLKEGIKLVDERYIVENQNGVVLYTNDPILAFSFLINKVSGKGTWEKNPWVFVYSFRLVK